MNNFQYSAVGGLMDGIALLIEMMDGHWKNFMSMENVTECVSLVTSCKNKAIVKMMCRCVQMCSWKYICYYQGSHLWFKD